MAIKLRNTAVLLLLALLLTAEPGQAEPAALTGYASGYDHGVMEGVIRHRFNLDMWRNPPPRDWYTAHGAIATNDCGQVGRMMTLETPDGREYVVLVADCAGRDSAQWMSDNRIIAELDGRLWHRLTTDHGKPLEVTLR